MPQQPTTQNPRAQSSCRDERSLRLGSSDCLDQSVDPQARRRTSIIRIALLLLVGVLPIVGGCGTVRPPANPVDPIPVYLADYGVHSSVILPTDKGKFVEYVFGDWNFAVENHDWFIPDVPRALFFSTSSGFGRRFLDEAPDGNPIIPPGSIPPLKSSVKIMVSRAAEQQVVTELDDRFKADAGPSKINDENQNVYAKDKQHYWLLNNCNHLSKHLLREMGCRVDGLTILSGFTVIQPKPLPAAMPATIPPAAPALPPTTAPASLPATQPGE
jgi:hypothetical protein